MVESISSPPDRTLSSESVKIEVVSLTKSSSCSSLPIENEPKRTEVFMLRSDCFRQEEFFLLLSTEPSQTSEVISFDWSNLTESHLHSSVPFQIVVNGIPLGGCFALLLTKGIFLVFYPQLLGNILVLLSLCQPSIRY